MSVVARFADLDLQKINAYAAELVQRRVAVVLAVGPQAVNATRGITTTVPIVALDLESDPVKSGLIERLSHPGSNVTGLFFDFPDFSTKWLELLGETIPGLTRLGILWDPGTGTVQLDAVTAAAQSRKLKLQVLQVAGPSGMDEAFQAANDAGTQAVLACRRRFSAPFPSRSPRPPCATACRPSRSFPNMPRRAA